MIVNIIESSHNDIVVENTSNGLCGEDMSFLTSDRLVHDAKAQVLSIKI